MMRPLDRRTSARWSRAQGCAAIGTGSAVDADEGPPETTTVRLPKIPGICIAPVYVAEELLRAEGFTDIRYMPTEAGDANARMVARRGDRLRGQLRRGVPAADRRRRSPSRCWPASTPAASSCSRTSRPQRHRPEGQDRRRTEPRLQPACSWPASRPMSGSTPPRTSTGSPAPRPSRCELFADGKIDAFLGFPPEPQELRARKIGRVDPQQPPSTGPGRSTSAACSPATRSSSAPIRSRPSAWCAPSSRRPTSASAEPTRRGAAPGRWRLHGPLRLRAPGAERGALRASGATTTPRTRCASMRCACTRPA